MNLLLPSNSLAKETDCSNFSTSKEETPQNEKNDMKWKNFPSTYSEVPRRIYRLGPNLPPGSKQGDSYGGQIDDFIRHLLKDLATEIILSKILNTQTLTS